MRAYLPDYELRAPKSLADALALMQAEPGVWSAFAGGTDLMVVFETGRLARRKFLSLWNLPELKGMRASTDFIDLGALTTYAEIHGHATMRAEFPLLCQAARETGAIAIQNRGTIGGNIANASPAADSPPALLVYDAQLELVSAAGTRWIDYSAFHGGYKKTALSAGELIKTVRLPRRTAGLAQYYRKAGTRKAQAISKVCLAATAKVSSGVISEARVALGSVAPVPLRCGRVEAVLRGRRIDRVLIDAATAALAAEISPIDDIRSTAVFRRAVACNLLEEFLCGIGSASSPS